MNFEKPGTIEKVVQELRAGNYVLPAIQREFVWREDRIVDLFESLMQRSFPRNRLQERRREAALILPRS